MYVPDMDRHRHPHVHVRYNKFKVVIQIPDGELLDGELPGRQMKLLQAWLEIHLDELMADWLLASTRQTPSRIDALR